MLDRYAAPRPVATTLYRLTPRGRQLLPALRELAHWGGPLLDRGQDGDEFRPHWLALVLPTWFDGIPLDGIAPLTVLLRFDPEPVTIEITPAGITALPTGSRGGTVVPPVEPGGGTVVPPVEPGGDTVEVDGEPGGSTVVPPVEPRGDTVEVDGEPDAVVRLLRGLAAGAAGGPSVRGSDDAVRRLHLLIRRSGSDRGSGRAG